MPAPAARILYAASQPDGRTPCWRVPTIWAAAEGKGQKEVAIADLAGRNGGRPLAPNLR